MRAQTLDLDLDHFIAARSRDLPIICSKTTAAWVDELRRQGKDVLPLKPYPDLPLPTHLVEAANRAVRENHSVPGTGSAPLKQAIATKLARETGWGCDPASQVVVTSGAMQALNVVFRALLNPGDEAVYASPSYFFFGGIQLVGGVPVTVPTDEASEYRWDLAAIERAITRRTKLLVVHSPVNPTGVVLAMDVLAGLADICASHNLLMIYDESYDGLVYDGLTHRNPAEIPAARDRLIVIRSLTKSYAMSPWRVGYIVAPRPLAEQFGKLIEWEQLMCSHVGQAAAVAALTGPSDWLANVRGSFEANRDRLWPVVNAIPGLSCVKPQGGPFLFINSSELGLSGDAFHERLLDDFGIPTEPGSFFGSEWHVRLSLGAEPPVIEETARRLRAAA